MRSKKSFFNGTVFKKNITHYWPIWVLFLIYLIYRIPIRILGPVDTGDMLATLQEQQMDSYFSVLSSALQPVACFAGGVISAMAVFHYMYFSRNAQAYHSFPVRREELFFTNYISGWLFYTVPLLLSFLLGTCICAFRGITSVEYLFLWFLLMEGMCFFFYNMTILVGMFTGQFFVVPLLTLALNYLYIGCRSVLLTIVGMLSYGLSDIYSERLVSFMSPLNFMMEKVNFMIDWTTQKEYLVNGCSYVAVYTVLGILMGIVAFFMYRRRKLEYVGDTVIIHLVRPIFRWIFAGGISLLLTVAICNYIPKQPSDRQFYLILLLMIGLGIVAFFIAEALLQRKIRIFSKVRIMECVVYTGLVAAFLFGIEYNVFGLENRLPDINQIASAQVEAYYTLYEDKKPDIQNVLDIHRQVIASKEKFEAYETTEGAKTLAVRFYYKMKDGTPFIRNYVIPADDAYMEDTSSVAAQIYRKSCDVDAYYRANFCKNYAEASIQDVELSVYRGAEEIENILIPEEALDTIRTALEADIREGNIISIPGTEYGEANDFDYWNTISFTLTASNGIWEIWDENAAYRRSTEGYYTISFNRDCVHLVKALRQTGVVNDTDKRLLTWREYYEEMDLMDDLPDYAAED